MAGFQLAELYQSLSAREFVHSIVSKAAALCVSTLKMTSVVAIVMNLLVLNLLGNRPILSFEVVSPAYVLNAGKARGK